LRKGLRLLQRERMAASPLCDAKDLAAKLEDAYFEMFGRRMEILLTNDHSINEAESFIEP
jgi:hypothetical protein